jgi:hypothetical protein
MFQQLGGNQWATMRHDGELLELRWLPSTAEMTDGGFMATLCLLAVEVERARAPGLLSDAVELHYRPTPAMLAWRETHIIPRYGGAGVRRFAFLMAPGFPHAGREAVEGPAIYPTRWFVDRGAAERWVRGG